jgi:hypothetical protein
MLRRFSLLALALTVVLLIAHPLKAQDVRAGDAWQQVYQQLPDFPRENQYVSRESGKVAENNTLIGRLIRYHIYIKSRPVNFRLDWKLTLADYLGANERMPAATYPSADTLRTNPMQGDIAVIRSLDRTQRDALVQTLVLRLTLLLPAPRPLPHLPPPLSLLHPTHPKESLVLGMLNCYCPREIALENEYGSAIEKWGWMALGMG